MTQTIFTILCFVFGIPADILAVIHLRKIIRENREARWGMNSSSSHKGLALPIALVGLASLCLVGGFVLAFYHPANKTPVVAQLAPAQPAPAVSPSTPSPSNPSTPTVVPEHPSRTAQPAPAPSLKMPPQHLIEPSSAPSIQGTDNTLYGNVGNGPIVGSGNTIVGATDDHGNTIITQPMTVGNGARGCPDCIVIGAHAGPSSEPQQNDHGIINNAPVSGGTQVVQDNRQYGARQPAPQADFSLLKTLPAGFQKDDPLTTDENRIYLAAPGAEILIFTRDDFQSPVFHIVCESVCIPTLADLQTTHHPYVTRTGVILELRADPNNDHAVYVRFKGRNGEVLNLGDGQGIALRLRSGDPTDPVKVKSVTAVTE